MLRELAVGAMLACAVSLGCQQKQVVPVDGIVTLEIPAAAGSEARKSDDASHPVQLAPGNTLVVKLGAFGATGYVWEMAGPAPAVLTGNGTSVTEPQKVNGVAQPVGGGTWTTFRFLAIAQGQGDMRFLLRRPWEGTAVPARTINVPVTVKITQEAEKKE